MSKHILLISYTFPPYPGIGGRRWAKFAKYLSALGYTVHVIHAKNPFNEESLWMEDVALNANIKLYQLSGFYPKILTVHPKSLIEKIGYKLALILVNLFSKGTPYDKSAFWKKPMVDTSVDLIKKHKIKNVIVSCAPFSSAYYALKLTKLFEDLNLLVDLRDPWTWGTGYGFTNLNVKRFGYEKMMESEVIKNCNYLLVPTNDMKVHLEKVYPEHTRKIISIPHGFDRDEVLQSEKKSVGTTRCVLYGTLYAKQDGIFEDLASAIQRHKAQIGLDIYSSSDTYKSSFEKKQLVGGSVNYYHQLLPKELFKKISVYSYVLIVQPDYAKDFITTKIYEIIYSGTPILLISNQGILSDFITSNKLGLWIRPENILEGFERLLNEGGDPFQIKQFPIENYSFETLTSQLVNYLK